MPITRTVAGLIYFDELDSESGWSVYEYGKPYCSYVHGSDISDKQSGSASLKCAATSGPAAGAYFYYYKTINVGAGAGRRVSIWHKLTKGTYVMTARAAVFYHGAYNQGVPSSAETATHDWQRHQATILSTITGSSTVYIDSLNGGWPPTTYYGWVDRLVISQSQYVTVSGLTVGQKVELYRASDDTLIDSETAAGASVVLDVDAEDYPKQMYLKVYATDGVTLVETTVSYEMCGGDTWVWTTGAGTITIATDAPIIYRSAAAGTPKTANITATLKTLAGDPYPNKTITFTTTLGAVSPGSDLTDANGEAETALTSATYGIAVMKAEWAGDATVPACSAYCTVYVFYEAEAPDDEKAFQFFCMGIEFAFTAGKYAWNEGGEGEAFEVEIPEWASDIVENGLVGIYRRGIGEFSGVLKSVERSLGETPRVKLSGPDVSCLLGTRVVTTMIYDLDFPHEIISALLTEYPSGISEGVLGECEEALTITFETELLRDAIKRICDLVGWHFRINMNRTLDFAQDFTGGITATDFQEGVNIISCSYKRDFWEVTNRIRMRGDGIVSTVQDGTMIAGQGLLEGLDLQNSITDQETLDLACQALVDLSKVADETIQMEAVDNYDPGTFGVEDQVQITSSTLGLSGYYTVKRIERNMMDEFYARMDISNRSSSYEKLQEKYRRMIKDASV